MFLLPASGSVSPPHDRSLVAHEWHSKGPWQPSAGANKVFAGIKSDLPSLGVRAAELSAQARLASGMLSRRPGPLVGLGDWREGAARWGSTLGLAWL